MCEQIDADQKMTIMEIMIDRALYEALEAMEQVAARQQAEIDRLRRIIELDEIMLKAWRETGYSAALPTV